MTDDWISLKEAASLLRCHSETLRKRGADGGWLNYPKLSRRQPGGEHSRIWLLRSEILAFIEQLETEAKAQAMPRQIQEVAAELKLPPETIDRFRRKGYQKALKAIGVKV